MSAPDTNIEKQTRRHRWPLIVIIAAIVFGAGMFLTIFTSAVDDEVSTTDDAVMMEATEGGN